MFHWYEVVFLILLFIAWVVFTIVKSKTKTEEVIEEKTTPEEKPKKERKPRWKVVYNPKSENSYQTFIEVKTRRKKKVYCKDKNEIKSFLKFLNEKGV